MKTLFSQNFKNRFLLLLLIVTVSLLGMGFSWFIQHFSANENIQMSAAARQYSIWLAAAVILIIAGFFAACLKIIRALRKSYEILLGNNAELKKTEEALRQSEAHYRIVTESASDAIITINQEHTILFVNKAAEKIFGFTVGEILGKKLFMLIPERSLAAHIADLNQDIARGKQNISRQGVELPAFHKDGYEVMIEVTFGEIMRDGNRLFTAIIRDITKRKRAEEALQTNYSLLNSTFEATADGILVVDLNNEIVTFNKNFVEMLSIPKDIAAKKDSARILAWVSGQLKDSDDLIKKVKQSLRQPEVKAFSILEFADGTLCERYSYPQILDGKVVGRVISFRDITRHKRAEAALRESESKMRAVVESMSEGLLQVDNKDCVQFVNNRLCEMVGYSQNELMGADWTRLLLEDEGRGHIEKVNERRLKGFSDSYEMRLRKKSGESVWVIIGGAPTLDAEGIVTGSMGVFTDISERKRAEEQLLHDAFHDGMTGLANRALFMDHLRMTIERGKNRRSSFYAILFLDFDRFKVVNDSLGHAEGDRLLSHIARRLESATRTGDLVARLGGDEFVVLLSDLAVEDDAVEIAERIQTGLKNSFDLNGREIFITASVGIALSTAGHKCAEDMLRDADIAMYRAKAKGRAQYQIFDQTMHEQACRKLQIETEMRQAFEREEFELHYQPIISLETETLTGFEALVRWKHPMRGMIPPFEFIGAAEENGLILPLGNWILQESCRQLRRWQDENAAASGLTISVNLSSKQFLQPDLAEQIAATLAATELDPRCLKLEITESHIMEKTEMAVIIMNKLRSLGVELSLDDFGTGYSSLSYLHRLPINNLKIDRSFVSRMSESRENSEIVSTIIKLAQNLKMKVVAEGIETADQLAQLNRLNCEYGQGYFFSKPLEAEKAEMFINDNCKEFSSLIKEQVISLELNM